MPRKDIERRDLRPDIAPLAGVVRSLRDAENGCPWDLKQTHDSMRRHLVEETYEVIDAIEDRDDEALREELGDVAFQVVFHAQLAQERGAFELQDVLDAIAEKMIHRHPHVFDPSHPTFDSPEEVRGTWESRKKRRPSVLAGIPRSLPALDRAQRVTSKAGAVGFDWPDVPSTLAKLDEEVAELKEAIATGDKARMEDELGDALFALVNVARKLELQAGEALDGTLRKFHRRFSHVETTLAAAGRDPIDATLEEMDALWDEAKRQEPR
jgi:MazG family protein